MMRSPTLLITGASGYLGASLIRKASTAGEFMPWAVTGTYFSRSISHPGCEIVPLDLRDRAAVRRLLAGLGPDVVLHTAADMSSVEAMQAVIVEGTRHLAGACASVGAHLIHLSTDVVFDGERAPYTETDSPAPLHEYGWAKAAAERIVIDLCPDAAIVRTSLIYGFEPPDPRTQWVVDSVRTGAPITLFTDEIRCPVWVEQLAGALLELVAARQTGIWHLAGAQPLNRYDFGVRLARFHALDPAAITPSLSRDSGLLRPRDCRLDVRKAQTSLQSPLWGVDETLAYLKSSGWPAGPT